MGKTGLEQNRHILFVILVIIALGGTAMFYGQQKSSPPEPLIIITNSPPTQTATIAPTPTATPAPVRVYITGAIVKPDVYFLPAGSIVKDVIKAAGGLTQAADLEQFNQALELKDQQHIHIPRLGEKNAPPPVQDGATVEQTPPPNSATSSPAKLININSASLEQLDTLPRIGPTLAQNIVTYRESHGGFKTIEEIKEVSGIGESAFKQLKTLITVE
jgi:competence protein ComEA